MIVLDGGVAWPNLDFKAGEEVRTLDIQLGKLTLYQLSYARDRSGNLNAPKGVVNLRFHFEQCHKPAVKFVALLRNVDQEIMADRIVLDGLEGRG